MLQVGRAPQEMRGPAPQAAQPCSPKIKIREEGKQMGPLTRTLQRAWLFPSFPGGIPTLLSHREDKHSYRNLMPSRHCKSVANCKFLLPALPCLPMTVSP